MKKKEFRLGFEFGNKSENISASRKLITRSGHFGTYFLGHEILETNSDSIIKSIVFPMKYRTQTLEKTKNYENRIFLKVSMKKYRWCSWEKSRENS